MAMDKSDLGLNLFCPVYIQSFFTANSSFGSLNKYQSKVFASRNAPLHYSYHLRYSYIINYT